MAIGSAAASGPFKFLRPRIRPQSTDIAAAATWGRCRGHHGPLACPAFRLVEETVFREARARKLNLIRRGRPS